MIYLTNTLINSKLESIFFNYTNILSKIDISINHYHTNTTLNKQIQSLELDNKNNFKLYCVSRDEINVPLHINIISIENEISLEIFNTYLVSIKDFKKNDKMKSFKI
jgi:hypothetical protein